MSDTKPKQIKSLKHLKELARADEDGEGVEVFIKSGPARLSKRIRYYATPQAADNDGWDVFLEPETEVFTSAGYEPPGPMRETLTIRWEVFHDISDSWAEYTDDEALALNTTIVEAVEKNALYAYNG